MAENKKSFVLYSDQKDLFDNLSNDEAGILIKHIFSYVNDENPIAPDKLTLIAFEPIKRQLKRDLQKYEAKREQWSEAGKKSAEVKRALKNSTNVNERLTESTNVENVATESTVNVTVTVNDNVNVIKDIDDSHEIFLQKLISEDGRHEREAIQMNIKKKINEEICREFNSHLLIENKHHDHFSEWIRHLRNWLVAKPNIKQGKNEKSKVDKIIESSEGAAEILRNMK